MDIYKYKARLMYIDNIDKSIYDGDTIKLSADLGFGIMFDIGPCRIIGIDTPEMRGSEREQGIIVRDYVRSLFKSEDMEEFYIQTHKDKKGKYGRYLVDIYLPSGKTLSEDLLEKNYAEIYK